MYNLVLEYRVKDFMPIDINILLHTHFDYSSIEAIDSFTKKYSEDEIKEMIVRENIVSDDYIKGSLKIINENKYRYKCLFKEDNFSLDSFFNENIDNKQLMNKFINIFMKYTDKSQKFIKALIEKKDVVNIIKYISELKYLEIRNIYFYLKEEI